MSEEMETAMQKRLLELSDSGRDNEVRAAAAKGIGTALAASTLAAPIDKFTETLKGIVAASKAS